MGLRVIERIKKMEEPIQTLLQFEREIPRIQKLGDTTRVVSKNVESFREHHFDRLIDIGLQHPDREKGIEILEGVSEIAKTYGKYRNTKELKDEFLRHLKNVYKLHQTHRKLEPERAFDRSHEIIVTLAAIAKKMREHNIDGKLAAQVLAHARAIEGTNPRQMHQMYLKRLNAIREVLERSNSESAARTLAMLVEKWRKQNA